MVKKRVNLLTTSVREKTIPLWSCSLTNCRQLPDSIRAEGQADPRAENLCSRIQSLGCNDQKSVWSAYSQRECVCCHKMVILGFSDLSTLCWRADFLRGSLELPGWKRIFVGYFCKAYGFNFFRKTLLAFSTLLSLYFQRWQGRSSSRAFWRNIRL